MSIIITTMSIDFVGQTYLSIRIREPGHSCRRADSRLILRSTTSATKLDAGRDNRLSRSSTRKRTAHVDGRPGFQCNILQLISQQFAAATTLASGYELRNSF
jgi:hypothetical protein